MNIGDRVKVGDQYGVIHSLRNGSYGDIAEIKWDDTGSITGPYGVNALKPFLLLGNNLQEQAVPAIKDLL